ncbi:histone deacetylase HOS3 [Tremella mesenterica]|uniref:Histone deacetylase HOS3 n=1 Tax=Tremella mesenterica TaxID=5217 RepID=A0A4Q1BRM5_TREME|nr:histone deacetylase HOS3 [Tremella mesenterica]
MTSDLTSQPLGLFIQPACLQHRYIRHANSSHIFERPERLRAVLLGVAAAIARLEENDGTMPPTSSSMPRSSSTSDDLSSLLSSLSIQTTNLDPCPQYLSLVTPPAPPINPGSVLLHHPALQLAHSTPTEGSLPYVGLGAATISTASLPTSKYLRELHKWAAEAVEKIRDTGCEIPSGLGLNQGDLYLGPGSILAIEGAVQTICQAVDMVCARPPAEVKTDPMTPTRGEPSSGTTGGDQTGKFCKAFCAIRPPGHHCGEDAPSGFCYVNNVVTGAMHAYLQHDVDRAVIIDFDLHHGNGTQALVMPLNAASHAEDLAVKAGKPPTGLKGRDGKTRRGWKGFYGSVHDIYSYPCEDGDLDLISDASISLAAHGQFIENIHLQPYTSEEDFYERIYPQYLALLDKAKHYLQDTQAEPSRTLVFISAGFDACEHEYQTMQRHDRRVPVSFFSRYTRDIVSFANEFTEGKIVSVLEGGYSDRALTSAAMGHAIGLLDREGLRSWWTEEELICIEKATKKKRTGKIAPFPIELSSSSHLLRTHTLLSIFEGSDPSPASNTTTPQPASRMTLRGRRANGGDESTTSTPTAIRRGRGRGGTPAHTPRTRGVGVGSPSPTPIAAGKRTQSPKKTPHHPLRNPIPDLDNLPPLPDSPLPSGAELKVEPPSPTPPVPPLPKTLPTSSSVPEGLTSFSSYKTNLGEDKQRKIILKFRTPSPLSEHEKSNLYPDRTDKKLEYREGSSTSESTTTDYTTAPSESEREVRETSEMSVVNDTSGTREINGSSAELQLPSVFRSA